MSTRLLFAAMLLASLLAPVTSSAQGLGIAARAGTLGLGAEGVIGLGDRLAVRGGIGLLPLEVESTINDLDVTLDVPRRWYNVGVDLYLSSVVRLGGGMLFRSDDVTLTGVPNTAWNIGGRDFTPGELGTLVGRIESGRRAPYVLLGFGRHTSSGVGLSLDLGAALLEEPAVFLDTRGGSFSDQEELRLRLNAEARELEDAAPTYIRIWPILNLGLRVGVGD